MEIKKTLELIPKKYKGGFYRTTILSILRAFLDLTGLASLLPIILLIIDESAVTGNSFITEIVSKLNIQTGSNLGLYLALIALLWIPLKSVVTIAINRSKYRYLLSLYQHYSNTIFNTYHTRGLQYIRENHSSQLSIKINGACYGFSLGIIGTIINLVSDFSMFLLLLAVVLFTSLKASLLLLVSLVPILAIYFFLAKKKVKDLGKKGYQMRQDQAMLVQESLRGYTSVTVNGSKKLVFDEFKQGLKNISTNDISYSIYGQLPSLLLQLCVAVALIVLMFLSDSFDNSTSIFVVFGFVAIRMLPTLLNLSNSLNTLQNSSHILNIIKDITKDEVESSTELEDDNDIEALDFKHSIRMNNICFSFDDGVKVLDNFSLEIQKGEIVGFKGNSGIGKSTTFNILLGLYQQDSGEIYVDQTKLVKENIKRWYKIVGYAEQDAFISNKSLAYNIAMRKDIDSQRIWDVLQKVGLKERFESEADGIHTVLNEQGANLSGGERQRISIARVLYKKASILLLDETTSALDAKNEINIVTLLKDIAKKEELTILLISHRDTTLKVCDRIIEMR